MKSAAEGWIRKLIDPSRRNNLLFFRDFKLRTFDLTAAPDEAIAALLSPECDQVTIERFVSTDDLPSAAARLQEIRSRALANREERGLETLFLALGMAAWAASDDGRPYAAPVLLMPVSIEQRGTDRRRLSLIRTGDVQVNLVLTYHLESQGIRVDPAQLLSLVEGDDDGEEFDLTPAFELLNRECGALSQFEVERRFVLGNFSFQEMSMVEDLRERVSELAAHDIVAAIAQDPAAQEAVRGGRGDIDPREFDRRTPDEEFLVLDADSTQQRAIAGALAGQSGVIREEPDDLEPDHGVRRAGWF